MKWRRVFYAAIVTLLLLPGTSQADRYYRRPLPAPYISAFFGVSIPRDTDVTGSFENQNGTFAIDDTIEFDPNINVGGTAGFDFGMVRLEGELSYKHAEMSTVAEKGGARYVNVDGRVGAFSMLFNGFIDLHNDSPITPYFGGGIGFSAVHISDTSGDNTNTGFRELLYLDDDDTVFAYQVGAGMGITLTRLVTLDVGYRYFGTSTARFTESSINPEFKLESHNVAIGLRFTF